MGFLANAPLHPCCPRRGGGGGCTWNILPVFQEKLPCTRSSVLTTAIQLLRDWEGVSVSGCRAGAQNSSWTEFWKLKVTFDATPRRKIQHLIRISICRPTNNGFFHWKYGFGQWWNRWLWNRADEKAAASSRWRRGSALLFSTFCSLTVCTAAQHEDFAPVKWDKVSVSASPPLIQMTKTTSELETEETAELRQADAPAESWRIQNVLLLDTKLWEQLEQAWEKWKMFYFISQT